MSEENDRFRRMLGSVKRRFRPKRFVSVSRKTDRVHHQSAAFFRLLLELGSREILPVIGTLREASSESSSRLASSIVLWWDRIFSRSKPRRLVVLVPSTWSPEQLDNLRYLRIPLRCFSLDLQKGATRLVAPKLGGFCRGSTLRLSPPESFASRTLRGIQTSHQLGRSSLSKRDMAAFPEGTPSGLDVLSWKALVRLAPAEGS